VLVLPLGEAARVALHDYAPAPHGGCGGRAPSISNGHPSRVIARQDKRGGLAN
jgi:hypothetical protein